jgi:uncharacterized membrane protein
MAKPEIIKDIENNTSRSLTVNLPTASWTQDTTTELYEQSITVEGLKVNDKVDFDASVEVKQSLKSAIHSENTDGVLKAITETPPEIDIEIQLTIYSLA